MAIPSTNPDITLPFPYAGVNFRDALAAMDPSFCVKASNWEFDSGFARVRGAWEIFHTLNDEDQADLLIPYKDTLFWVGRGSGDTNVYDVTATGDSDTADADLSFASTVFTNATYMQHADILYVYDDTDVDLCVRYDSGWSATDSEQFQYSAAVQTAKAAISYRGRAYLAKGQYLYYSDLSAVQGDVLSRVDLLGVFENAQIDYLAKLTSPSGINSETLLVIGNYFGEVAIYAGDNPEAANWEIAADFKIPPSLDTQGRHALQINNDVWVPTKAGLYSIRRMLTEVETDNLDKVTVSGPINPYWTKLASDSGGSCVFITHWPERNKVYVLFEQFYQDNAQFSGNDESTIFVYNTVTKAWGYHRVNNFQNATQYLHRNIIQFNNDLYCCSGKHVLKLNLESFRDEDLSSPGTYTTYQADLHGAWIQLPSGAQRVTDVDLLIRSTFTAGSFRLTTKGNFGRLESETGIENFIIDTTNYYANPLYTCGIEARFVRYGLTVIPTLASGSGEIGGELYSVGMKLQP